MLEITSSQNLKLIGFITDQNDLKITNQVDSTNQVSEHRPEFQNLLKQYYQIFKAHLQLLDYEATLHTDESIQPIHQTWYRYRYHLR